MIRNASFIKRQIGNQTVLVAVGEATKRFHGMISLNKTAAFIWDLLESEKTLEEIAAALAINDSNQRSTRSPRAQQTLQQNRFATTRCTRYKQA